MLQLVAGDQPGEKSRAALTVLAGPGCVLDLGTTLAGRAVLGGRTVLYVDGANAFDPYILSRLAREAGQPPKAIMQRLRLARAFTCHQLETLLVERLPGAIAHFRPGLVVISGWSHLFHDENVPTREALRLLQGSALRVHALAETGQPILATHPEEPATPRLRPLEAILVRAADTVLRLREDGGRLLAVCEKPEDSRGARPLQVACERDLPWISRYRHQELLAAYPWSGR
ncbi:MAG: hypothetical protein HY712_05975 [candidate division NC10 bacterium]|nr:hypothetical protein [candidate division NC10 bacterium]